MKNDFEKDITALRKLGMLIQADTPERAAVIETAGHYNPWFTRENILSALNGISSNLDEEHLREWLRPYASVLPPPEAPLNVGLVLAGNIPLVGFHDILCVLVSGHRAMIKMSGQDQHLTTWLLEKIGETAPFYAERISVAEQLEKPDAVIATGSNNSARYFEQYFGKYPHIIRKNRNTAAILTGEETQKELEELGKDIFLYFGLGCRNVSKLFVPPGYDFQQLLDALEPYREVIEHHKYANNYGYQHTIRLMNRELHFTNGFILLTENPSYASPIATLHYEFYQGKEELEQRLRADAGLLQCTASAGGRFPSTLPFGQTQYPALRDYADNVDTLEFLCRIGSFTAS
ncbi:acyl-CoA reductase LuxC [Anseongella ginsenosidimutans]|uniref:Acyl-CoA reductase LuxC n=1 Tax=Anseongella ginsenosidimutans TaxID=496056 RepID=A0A4R3KU90_9SPHI|nr:acyl-CoA reductase [Anseongella ginsenosidimutans]QEC52963.1 acyl-CoA reductase [Anseongella ginsenosidimutans]TCS87365.1 acyl-CoA reductase LuxC [Anseongella ginsenosidimutans]